MPYIFDYNGHLRQTKNLAGLVTISPGNDLIFNHHLKMFSDSVGMYTDQDFKGLDLPTLIFYGEYDSTAEIDSRTLRKIKGNQQ